MTTRISTATGVARSRDEVLQLMREAILGPTGLFSEVIPDESQNSDYMAQILATPVEYHPHIIEALRDFKRNHKIGNESNEARLEGMRVLLAEIACSQGIRCPELEMRNINGRDSGLSYYDKVNHKIVMRGKLSIVTLLHEIAHSVFRHDEHMARVWSINLFKKVYPKAFKRLEVVDGFVLKIRDNTIQAPVSASSSVA
jgi:hypothetical protein